MIKKQIIIGISLVILIALLVTGIYKFTHIKSLQVTEVAVVGGKTIPHEEVESLAREAFAGTYLKLIPESFRFMLPKTAVVEAIKTVDRVKNVKVDVKDSDTLLVVYDEYLPIALWCASIEDKNCLFLDQTGYAFAEAPHLTGNAFVRYIEDGKNPEKHTFGLDSDFMKANKIFINNLEDELDLYVTSVEKVGEYDVDYVVSGGGKIRTSQTMDLEKSFKNLRTLLQSGDFSHIASGDFQYIDLRFGDKVFVNEELAPTEVTPTTE